MRPTVRLLAKVKPSRYLEPLTPTGLTGLTTHPSPRPTLIYLYKLTLEKLKTFPESSVYRHSTEALTQHRLRIVESTKPPGYDAWLERVEAAVAEDPERFKAALKPDGTYVAFQKAEVDNTDGEEWNGEQYNPQLEGPYKTEEDMERFIKESEEEAEKVLKPEIHLEAEPPLESVQISEIENQIGAGLIEEVIQVAQGELQLVDEMLKSKVWEELEEKPKPDQWTYFERGADSSQS